MTCLEKQEHHQLSNANIELSYASIGMVAAKQKDEQITHNAGAYFSADV